jgi:hypothetical protein
MEAESFCETLVPIYRTEERHFSEVRNSEDPHVFMVTLYTLLKYGDVSLLLYWPSPLPSNQHSMGYSDLAFLATAWKLVRSPYVDIQ